MFNAPFLNKQAAGEKVYDLPRGGPSVLVKTIFPRRGSKTEYHFVPIAVREKQGYMIYRISDALDRHVKFLRAATPKEVASAMERYNAVISHNQESREQRST